MTMATAVPLVLSVPAALLIGLPLESVRRPSWTAS